jgi:hypothetical protein
MYMKRLILCIPVFLFCAFIACRKAKGPPNAKSVQPNNNLDSTVMMSAAINGANWKTDSAYGYRIRYSGNDSNYSNLMITATKHDSVSPTTIKFSITRFNGPNTYVINPPINTATYYDANNVRHYATSGSIVVATDTAYALRGTFSFVADTVSITNGIFDVALP